MKKKPSTTGCGEIMNTGTPEKEEKERETILSFFLAALGSRKDQKDRFHVEKILRRGIILARFSSGGRQKSTKLGGERVPIK